eukprot:scaffold22596_cov131-Cylindrotheca_fusiformis.AAC.5
MFKCKCFQASILAIVIQQTAKNYRCDGPERLKIDSHLDKEFSNTQEDAAINQLLIRRLSPLLVVVWDSH